MRSSRKILMIVIIIIVVLAIVGTVLGYLYIKTDFLKSNKELFGKYIMQDIQKIQQMTQSNIYQTYKDIKNQNMYEMNTDINISYSEGGEISNPFNGLTFNFKEQKDNGYSYRNAKILYQDESYFEIEGIKDEDLYGIRFPNEIKQYLSIRNTDNAQYLEKVGINEEILVEIMQILDNNNLLINEIFTEEEIKTLANKYFNIIKEGIENASFSNQKNVLITLNNNTIKANSYTATLQPNQVQEIINQLLGNIENDEIILNKIDEIGLDKEKFINQIDEYLENLGIDQQLPTVKITVYSKDGETLRTVIEYGVEKVTIENSIDNNVQKLNIQKIVLNDNEQKEQTIEIQKAQENSNENYNIKLNIVNGTQQENIEFNIQMQNNNDYIETITNIKYIEEITNIEITLNNTVNTEIAESTQLDETNNIILTDLDDATRENVLNIVKTVIPERITSRIQEIIEKLKVQEYINQLVTPKEELPQEEEPIEETENSSGEQMSQVDINRFNAKFEFYTGNEVSSGNVKTLLDIAKSHLNSVEISENGEIKLIIEKDKENTEQMNKALEQIEDKGKYKVAITYKDSNGMVDYITINKIEED